MSKDDIENDPIVRIRVHDIIEALRLNRVEIRNLPIPEYANYLIQNEISQNDFMYFVPNYTAMQPYFRGHVMDLYDTVMGILLEENLEFKMKYQRCKEYPR